MKREQKRAKTYERAKADAQDALRAIGACNDIAEALARLPALAGCPDVAHLMAAITVGHPAAITHAVHRVVRHELGSKLPADPEEEKT